MTNTGTRAGKAAGVASLTAVLMGVGVLAGWFFDVGFLKSLVPGIVAMNPATAVAFILAGTSLILALQSSRGPDRSRTLLWMARSCALVVALTGFVKFVGYLCGADLPPDQWLFASRLSEGGFPLPNRIAPNTALNMLLLGTALLFGDRNNRLIRSFLHFFVGLVCLGALIAVLGHAYHVSKFYGFGHFSPMSLYTSTIFLVMCCAFFLAHTDGGLPAVLVGKSSGGILARRLLPAAVFIPAGFGWLELRGEKMGLFDNEFGNALFAVGGILIFVFLVCWSSRSLFRADLEREKVGKALQWQTALLEAQVNSSIDGILVVDRENNQILQNQRMVDLFKIPKEIVEDKNDENQLKWVATVVKNSPQFMERVFYLNSHPDEVNLDRVPTFGPKGV
jgi:PAS domain-containing protein